MTSTPTTAVPPTGRWSRAERVRLGGITLPLLFAAGMSAMDTADSLLMSRAYSWAYRQPARRLWYNLATTGMTVLVGGLVASVYLAGLLADHLGVTALAGYASIADHFEQLGYAVVALFVLSWGGAVAVWRLCGYDRRYRQAGS